MVQLKVEEDPAMPISTLPGVHFDALQPIPLSIS
jgi:hypothetical protein